MRSSSLLYSGISRFFFLFYLSVQGPGPASLKFFDNSFLYVPYIPMFLILSCQIFSSTRVKKDDVNVVKLVIVACWEKGEHQLFIAIYSSINILKETTLQQGKYHHKLNLHMCCFHLMPFGQKSVALTAQQSLWFLVLTLSRTATSHQDGRKTWKKKVQILFWK